MPSTATPISLRVWIALLFVFLFLAPLSSQAIDTPIMNVGIRAGITGASVIGEEQRQSFGELDAVAQVALPWRWYSESGWGAGTRLLFSVGALNGAGETGFITSLVPLLSLGSRDGRFSLDAGVGGALLSHQHFGQQEFGGPFQVVATVGAGLPVYHHFGIGYRFQHYSDAGLYGPDSRGADFHNDGDNVQILSIRWVDDIGFALTSLKP